jgi:UDP-N-acetylmuramate: L-alanyl-gamma-D-glutamyl-meso-diaminopimelate ligase
MKTHIHFIAIGGAAMHNLAIALHKNGFKVTGSDDHIFDPSRTNLLNYGLLPEKEGWFPDKITSEIDAVILGMHARIDNPELQKAHEAGLKIYSFPEFIYEHSKHKIRVVIGGSHGKTSITGMILHVLTAAGVEVDYLLGASVPGIDGNVRLSDTAEVMVIEGDEYLTSPIDPRPKFHLYRPHIAVISGIAWDHINVFKTFEEYKKQFEIFATLIEPEGKLIYCSEDENTTDVAMQSRKDIEKLPYALPPHHIHEGKTFLKTVYGEVGLNVFGNHNLLNIEAARLTCQLLNIGEELFYNAISSWQGAYNRLTKIHDSDHLVVFRDFAHAPSKVEATVNAVRKQFQDDHFIACLELHTFSSLSGEFLPHYRGSMDNCDVALLYFNPQAVELKKLKIPQEQDIVNGFGNPMLQVFSNIAELQRTIQLSLNERAVILYMSSGNFDDMDLLFF